MSQLEKLKQEKREAKAQMTIARPLRGYSETDLDLVGMESQGCFAIGIGCAKKLFGSKLELYTTIPQIL